MPQILRNNPELLKLLNNRVKVCREIGAQARTQHDFAFAHRVDAHASRCLQIVKNSK